MASEKRKRKITELNNQINKGFLNDNLISYFRTNCTCLYEIMQKINLQPNLFFFCISMYEYEALANRYEMFFSYVEVRGREEYTFLHHF